MLTIKSSGLHTDGGPFSGVTQYVFIAVKKDAVKRRLIFQGIPVKIFEHRQISRHLRIAGRVKNPIRNIGEKKIGHAPAVLKMEDYHEKTAVFFTGAGPDIFRDGARRFL
jgi:cytochrome c-type biogenesis protein CcmE